MCAPGQSGDVYSLPGPVAHCRPVVHGPKGLHSHRNLELPAELFLTHGEDSTARHRQCPRRAMSEALPCPLFNHKASTTHANTTHPRTTGPVKTSGTRSLPALLRGFESLWAHPCGVSGRRPRLTRFPCEHHLCSERPAHRSGQCDGPIASGRAEPTGGRERRCRHVRRRGGHSACPCGFEEDRTHFAHRRGRLITDCGNSVDEEREVDDRQADDHRRVPGRG